MKYADIIVDISLEALDRVFQYIVPESMKQEIRVGSQVTVPFGKGNRMVRGYVVGFSDVAEYAPDKLKEIDGIQKGSMVVESQGLRCWPFCWMMTAERVCRRRK